MKSSRIVVLFRAVYCPFWGFLPQWQYFEKDNESTCRLPGVITLIVMFRRRSWKTSVLNISCQRQMLSVSIILPTLTHTHTYYLMIQLPDLYVQTYSWNLFLETFLCLLSLFCLVAFWASWHRRKLRGKYSDWAAYWEVKCLEVNIFVMIMLWSFHNFSMTKTPMLLPI